VPQERALQLQEVIKELKNTYKDEDVVIGINPILYRRTHDEKVEKGCSTYIKGASDLPVEETSSNLSMMLNR